MSSTPKVISIINSLKDLLSSQPEQCIITIRQDGHTSKSTCCFNAPVSKSELDDFLSKNNWYLPSDLREFYLRHNGGRLYFHPSYGGGIEILNLDGILRISKEIINIPKNWIPVAWTDHKIGSICIDSERCRLNQFPYLYFLDAIDSVEEAIPINVDFTTWLERLIICQGVEYWVWDFYDSLEFNT